MNKDESEDSPVEEPKNNVEVEQTPEEEAKASELAKIESVDVRDPALIDIESREAAATSSVSESVDPDETIKFKQKQSKDLWLKQKKWYIPLSVTRLIVIILAIPVCRFTLLGWAWKQPIKVAILDSTSNMPVPDADVTINNVTSQTDGDGIASFTSLALGNYPVKVEKANYKSDAQSVTVDVLSSGATYKLAAVATGKQVVVKVVDRISGEPVVGAELSSKDIRYGKSDSGGMVSVVLPIRDLKLDVQISAATYDIASTPITLQTKSISLVPTGSMYFLSKQSGKIDVVKTNLDGSNRQTIVAGTGSENDRSTSLLAARDWKYAILKAKRLPNKSGDSLYIFNTTKDTYDVMNDSESTFTPIGWMGHKFLYYSQKNGQYWQLKSAAIKSYDADNGTTTIIDENNTDPSSTPQLGSYESLSNFYITDSSMVYTKTWQVLSSGYATVSGTLDNKQNVIMTVKPDGTGRKTVKSFAASNTSDIAAKLYLPQEIYFRHLSNDTPAKTTFSEIEDGTYKDNISTVNNFDNTDYPTFVMSPSGKVSFWSEQRDGKNALFIGGRNAENKQQIATASEYKPYGWLSDKWVLLQKKDSELYIATPEQMKAGKDPLKISDYHKLNDGINGYGYGYGGQ